MYFIFLIIAFYMISKLDKKSILFFCAFFGLNAVSLYIADIFGLNGAFLFGVIMISIFLTFVGNLNFIGNRGVNKGYYLISFVFNLPISIFAFYKIIETFLETNINESNFNYILEIDSYLVNLIASANFYNMYLTGFIFFLIGSLPHIFMQNKIINQ